MASKRPPRAVALHPFVSEAIATAIEAAAEEQGLHRDQLAAKLIEEVIMAGLLRSLVKL